MTHAPPRRPSQPACLLPGASGIRIWKRTAPESWPFSEYNCVKATTGCSERQEALLAGSEERVVPYAANRMVIFRGNLFHQTDAYRFRKGYRNRRINLTFLFGKYGDTISPAAIEAARAQLQAAADAEAETAKAEELLMTQAAVAANGGAKVRGRKRGPGGRLVWPPRVAAMQPPRNRHVTAT